MDCMKTELYFNVLSTSVGFKRASGGRISLPFGVIWGAWEHHEYLEDDPFKVVVHKVWVLNISFLIFEAVMGRRMVDNDPR